MDWGHRKILEGWKGDKSRPQIVFLRSRVCLVTGEGIAKNSITKKLGRFFRPFQLGGSVLKSEGRDACLRVHRIKSATDFRRQTRSGTL